MRSLVFYFGAKATYLPIGRYLVKEDEMDVIFVALIIFLAVISFGFIALCDKV